MAESYSVKAILSAVDSGFTSTFSKAQSATDSLMKTVKGTALGALAFKGVSMAVSTLTSNVSSAISRFDTLNQYPKVLKQMGFSASDASKSVKELSDGIQGVPTSLDEIASSARLLTLTTGDLKKSTKLALAMNNAFLVSGSSAADASRGMTQFTQMLSRGKVGMEEWSTLNETMKYGLVETAKKLGITSGSTTELYDALKEGNITFDQFTDALIECSEAQGGFAELAKTSTAGIATSMTNLKTAIVKGMADSITAINTFLTSNKLPTITQMIDMVKDSTAEAFKLINGKIGEFNGKGQELLGTVKTIGAALGSFGIVSGANDFFQGKTWQVVTIGIDGVKASIGTLPNTIKSVSAKWHENMSKLSVDSIGKGIKRNIGNVRKDFRNFGKSIDSFGEAVALSMETVSTKFSNVGIQAWIAISGMGNKIAGVGNGIGKSLQGIVGKVTKTLRGIITKIGTILKPFQMICSAATGLVKTVGSAILGVGSKIASGVTTIMGMALKALMPATLIAAALAGLGVLYQTFGTQIDQMLSLAQTKGPQIITNLASGMASRLPELIQKGAQLVVGLMNTITANLPALIQGGVMLVQSLISGLISALPQLISSAMNMVSTLVTGLATALPQLIMSGMQLLLALAQGITQNLPQLINSAVTAISTFAQGILSNLPTILTTAAQIIGILALGLISAIPQLVTALPTVISAMVDTIMSTDWLAVGKQIVSAIGEGIFGGLSSIGGKIGNFFGSISDWFAGGEKGGQSVTSGTVSSINAGAGQVSSAATSLGTAAVNSTSTGIQAGMGALTTAANSVATTTTTSLAQGITGGGAEVSTAATNVMATATSAISAGASTGSVQASGAALSQAVASGINQGAGSVKSAAMTITNNFAQGISSGSIKAVSAMQKSISAISNLLKNLATMAKTSGTTTGNNFNNGVRSGMNRAVSTARSMSASTVSAMRSAGSGSYSCGVYIGAGLANGMASQVGRVRSVAAQLAAAAEAAIRAKAQIHSPSKVADKLGGYFGEGWVNGISDRVTDAKKAAWKLVDIPDLVPVPEIGAGLRIGIEDLNDDYDYTRNETYTIYVPVEVDGRQVAKATAKYTKEEIEQQQKRDLRKKGMR